MIPIKSYTLKFYCLGYPIKSTNFKVYLRYYVTLNGKPFSASLNTDYTLTKQQVKLLNKNELGGAIQTDLDAIKSHIIQVIGLFNLQYNTYPTPDQLKEYLDSTQNALPMEKYISDYLKELKTKKSTKILYAGRLQQWKKYYDMNLTKTPIQSLINKVTIEKYGDYLRKQHQVRSNKQPLGDAYIHDLQSEAIRLLNMIAEQQKLKPVPFFLKTPKPSEQYTPTDEEFNQLISVVCTDNIQLVQQLIYINSFIGIRIDELLNIKKNNVHFNGDHVSIHFTDFKHSKPRDVVIIDSKAMNLMNKFVASANEDKLFTISPEIFNRNLKKLAQLAFDDKKVYLYSTKKEKDITFTISDVITSHCIRRYAIIRNIGLYGIDVARTFSGHTNYATVVKHYARDFMEKKIALDKMRKG
jgi:integrase